MTNEKATPEDIAASDPLERSAPEANDHTVADDNRGGDEAERDDKSASILAQAEHDRMLADRAQERAQKEIDALANPDPDAPVTEPGVVVEPESGPSTGIAPFNVNGQPQQ